MARAYTHPKYKALYEQMLARYEASEESRQDLELAVEQAAQRVSDLRARAKATEDALVAQRQGLLDTLTECQAILAGYAATEVVPAMEANAFYHPTRARHEIPRRYWLMLHCWFRGRHTYEQPVGNRMTWRGAPVIIQGSVPEDYVIQADGPSRYQEGR